MVQELVVPERDTEVTVGGAASGIAVVAKPTEAGIVWKLCDASSITTYATYAVEGVRPVTENEFDPVPTDQDPLTDAAVPEPFWPSMTCTEEGTGAPLGTTT